MQQRGGGETGDVGTNDTFQYLFGQSIDHELQAASQTTTNCITTSDHYGAYHLAVSTGQPFPAAAPLQPVCCHLAGHACCGVPPQAPYISSSAIRRQRWHTLRHKGSKQQQLGDPAPPAAAAAAADGTAHLHSWPHHFAPHPFLGGRLLQVDTFTAKQCSIINTRQPYTYVCCTATALVKLLPGHTSNACVLRGVEILQAVHDHYRPFTAGTAPG